ncbi:caspase family protein [Spirosoma spitsbergense]|uniref:caspase family protein n=1 Tax=Spirosoma spitsbergense TaxID=431554 RepID=UPI0003772F9B|nr:caspase family protein [Spirosoma spitsbergense]
MLVNVLLGLMLITGAAQPSSRSQTYAVVVGIADYQALTYRTGDLRFSDRDARQVAAFLRSKSGGSVPESHIRLLTNKQATLTAINQALTLFRRAGTSDRVILYFSGHGLPNGFVPYDAKPGQLTRILTYGLIKAGFHDAKAITKLCIADACLSGGLTRQKSIPSAIKPRTKDTNVAMILASRSTQFAVEDGRLAGGAFTYYLLRGLGGQGDLNGDGVVTIKELHQYVSPRVTKRTMGRQTPIFYGRFSDNLPLAYL